MIPSSANSQAGSVAGGIIICIFVPCMLNLGPIRQLGLPVLEIADAVNRQLADAACLVVTAPPGAGKSTVLPLTILAGFVDGDGLGPEGSKIIILEPRRIAARQIAERMAALLGEPVGRTVGYRIRFESRVSSATRIEVVTEGILTRMLVDDPALEGVGVVIFDEFHERSLASDVALALTREAQQLLRPDLRIVLMSATIDTEALCRALDAPLIESAGRMFPVEIRHTPEEASQENVAERVAHWVRVALREHEGDVLAFLPGEAEIRRCAELLEGIGAAAGDSPVKPANDGIVRPANDGKVRPTRDEKVKTANEGRGSGRISIFPLYGMLPPEQQRAAIAPSAPGARKVVLATPIAETSLTIEGVRVVVDGGFCRRMVFDPQNALSRLETVRISRDMADQRSGRAGRVASGVCYRLWGRGTEARMAATRVPEILEADLAGTVLDAAARLKGLTLPVFAINLGTLGYLAEVERNGWKEALDKLIADDYELADRMMLEGTQAGRNNTAYALNDVVISRSGALRLISINIYVDGQFLNTINADGIIVATPTGSTAYNLSAGGPIVEPTGDIIVITPICSQSMYARSLVFSASDQIILELAHSSHGDDNEAEASFDGRRMMLLREGDRIEIRKSERITRMVRISRQSFLQTLHKKLYRAEGFY